MTGLLNLTLTAFVPIIGSIALHLLFKVPKIQEKVSDNVRQIIAGIIFGVIAVMGTEFGVLYNGATMNVRDAAPICAGLIFGPTAGIIAGLIGGIERWFAVYWGAGMYTRLACTLSTAIVGILAALYRKYIFDNSTPSFYYALVIGAVSEVLHLTMVFVTNINDAKNAFAVVKACSGPMISLNAISVGLAVLFITIIDRQEIIEKDDHVTLSHQFQKFLVILVIIAFTLTTSFTSALQKGVSKENTSDLLRININDVINSINEASDANLMKLCREAYSKIEGVDYNNEYLIDLAEQINVPEIDVINQIGFITHSTNSNYVGFDMKSGDQSKEFMCLTKGVDEFVQAYQAKSFDSDAMKYAGKAMTTGGFIQVGYDAERFQKEINEEIELMANNRHIGETGGLLIIDPYGKIISDSRGLQEDSEPITADQLNLADDYKQDTIYSSTIQGNEVYFMYHIAEGYYVFAYQPLSEANSNRDLTNYLNVFMESLIFTGLFVLVYFLVKSLIVDNVISINNSLKEITEGNLDTKLNITENKEFFDLSKGINTTVDSLKHFIAEANARIDSELEYAKEIQQSSLPSMFPPFPNRDEFEIYATMDAAKEVGGDFYDFYFIDEHTLAFLIADVSGKSIPGAMFMMRAKQTIKTYADGGLAVNDIFTNANFNLCEGNKAEMFVTAWMAFLDLRTGVLKFANAGHNPPLLRRKDGNYEYLVSRAGFVLGGMEGIAYKEQEITLAPGDELFLYTDGVPEATDNNKLLFGDDRLYASVNRYRDESCEDICRLIRKDVDKFVGDAPQFDDITMLSLKFLKYEDKKEEN